MSYELFIEELEADSFAAAFPCGRFARPVGTTPYPLYRGINMARPSQEGVL